MIWVRHADGHVYGDDMVYPEIGGELVEGGVDTGTEAGILSLADDEPARGAAIDAVQGGGGWHGGCVILMFKVEQKRKERGAESAISLTILQGGE